MSESTLKYMADMMASLEIPYEFLRWNSGIPPDYYFTGDYIEEESLTKEENGFQRSTFILRGYTRQSAMLLERAKAKIEKNACKTAILPDGTGIAVFYATGGYVPTGDADLKSIKINLTIQEWRVN